MMQTANIHALLALPNPGEAPNELAQAAVQEGFALLLGFLNNVERIAGALEQISLNTHPTIVG